MRPRASAATTQVVFDRLTVRDAVAFADFEPFTERLLSDDAVSVHDVTCGAGPKETVCAEIAVERRTIAVKIIVRFMACSFTVHSSASRRSRDRRDDRSHGDTKRKRRRGA